jgi:precorrin-6B methylase 2
MGAVMGRLKEEGSSCRKVAVCSIEAVMGRFQEISRNCENFAIE